MLTPEQVEKSFALTDLFGKKGWNVAKSEFSGLGERGPLCVRFLPVLEGEKSEWEKWSQEAD